MTVTVAEQGAAAAEAGGAEASSGARSAFKSGTAPPPARKAANRPPRAPGMGPSRSGTVPPQRGRQGPAGRPGTPGPAGPQGGSQRRAQPSGTQRYLQERGERARRRAESAEFRGQPSDFTSYQAVILAEFVAAVLLVAATPFAKKDSAGVSPYVGSDLLQLVAITVVYFILALLSGANRGTARFAAWFGALILLTVGLAEAARLAKLLNVFGLAPPAPAAAESTGTSQAPGTTTAGGRG